MDLEEIADLVQHQEEELKNKEEEINQLQKEIRVLLSKANDEKLKEAEDLKEDMERVRYQNVMNVGCLEQAEEDEFEHKKKIITLTVTNCIINITKRGKKRREKINQFVLSKHKHNSNQK